MNLILKYFPELTEIQKSQFEKLAPLYEEWNTQINVISRKDMEHFYERHVLHSLSIAKIRKFRKDESVLDIGTGGGFPGIPLAILFPETQFHLVDSIGKKIKVVNEVAEALGLKNVNGEHVRAEELKTQYDFIVSRAVSHFDKFMPWTRGKFKETPENRKGLKNGFFFLKGGDLQEEMKNLKHPKVVGLQDFFEEEFFETKKVVYLRAPK